MLKKVENYAQAAGEAARGIDLTDKYNILRRRWKAIAITIALFVFASLVIVSAITPRYTARTEVMFDPKKQNVYQLQAAFQGMPLDTGAVESEVSIIKSFNISRRVVETLKLDRVDEFSRADSIPVIGTLTGLFSRRLPDSTIVDQSLTLVQLRAVRRLQSYLTVRRVGLTYVIEISAYSRDPKLAMVIVNAVAQAYLTEQLEARYEVANRATKWFSERLSGLREQVQVSERAVTEFRAKHGIVSNNQGGTIDKQQVSEISAQLILARAQTAEKRAKFEQAQRASRSGNSAAVSEALQSTAVSQLRVQEAEVARKEADLSAKYSSSHPSVVNARAELRDIRRAVSSEVSRIISNFKNEYEVALKREQSLEESLSKFTSVATQNDQVAIKLRELEQDLEANRTMYQSVLANMKQAKEQTTLESNESRVISPATTPATPSFPRRSIFLAVALFLGLVAGVSIAFLLDYIDNGFATAEQIEQMLNVPVLAVTPILTGGEMLVDGDKKSIPELVAAKPLSRFSESIRSVRIAIGLTNVDEPPKVILVTSSVPGEGKSTVASSLAVSAAYGGQRVLLIDADMRHPSTSNLFGLSVSKGLVDLLAGSVPPAEAIQQFYTDQLHVLPAGSSTKNPPDLLSSKKMQHLIRASRNSYDLIIVDTPPVTAVVDCLVVAPLVDKICFVVEWNNTPREAVQRAMNVLSDNFGRVAGVVLNKANIKQMKYYSTYYSHYNKMYKNYYSD